MDTRDFLDAGKKWTLRSMKVFGLLVLSMAFLIPGCGQKAAGGFERPPASVSVVVAVAKDVPVYIDAVGKTVAREVVSIQPQVTGRITEIHFADGVQLNKGDVLFTIDPRPYEAELHSQEATLAEKTAQLDLTRITLARNADLVEQKLVSSQDYDRSKNAVDVAEAQVKQSQAAVETARLDLDYCTIRSPIDGRAGHRLADIGNVVKVNGDPLLTIQRLDPIYADFTIAENDLSDVQQNMKKGTLSVEVRLPDEPDAPHKGDLTFLDNSVQQGSGTVNLRATIPNPDQHFWPGRFVNVRLVLNTLHAAVLVPVTASQMSAQGTFVYVVKADSTAELRPVTLGQRQGELIVISKGVQSGDQVVVNGQLGVTPGGKVRVEAPVADSSAAAGGGKS